MRDGARWRESCEGRRQHEAVPNPSGWVVADRWVPLSAFPEGISWHIPDFLSNPVRIGIPLPPGHIRSRSVTTGTLLSGHRIPQY